MGLFVLLWIIALLIPLRLLLPVLISPRLPDPAALEQEFRVFRKELLLNAEQAGTNHAAGRPAFPALNSGRPALMDAGSGTINTADEEWTVPLHPFDPNQISPDSLVAMGLARRTAMILGRYREAGGRFRKDSDLLRIYTLGPEDFNRLRPWIRIHPDQQEAGPAKRNKLNPAERIELNTADTLQLQQIYGIGPVFARRITAYRRLLGGYHHRAQLMEVYGMDGERYGQLAKGIWIDTLQIRQIALNQAKRSSLSRHPYLNDYQAAALIAYRETAGTYTSLSEISMHRLIPDSVYRKLRPYLHLREE